MKEFSNILNIEKSNILFNGLKSKYILQKILGNLSKKKLLYLIKYNKNIKNRMNININDYKKFSELFFVNRNRIKTFKR